MGIRFLCLIIGLLITCLISDIVRVKLQQKQAKKSNYNCDICDIYDCPNKHCRKHRDYNIMF